MYGNVQWGDKLLKFNGHTIAYDSMGNPTSYLGTTLSWQGKQLTTYVGNSKTISFSYNEDGLRLKKTVNHTDTNYYYNGSVLIGITNGSTYQRFSYDANGRVVSVDYSTDSGSAYTTYYYLRNAQGDIVKLIDGSGTTEVEYAYDSWGKKISTTGTLATTVGIEQPFRYRGYVYDRETQWYYLQSRYYDPSTGRFISADVLLSTGQGVLGHNAFAYCNNNPVAMADSEGSRPYAVCMTDSGNGNAAYYASVQAACGCDYLLPSEMGPFQTIDDAAIFVAPRLYNATKKTNTEYMAPIYCVDECGEKNYYLGQICQGMHDNVVLNTLSIVARDTALACAQASATIAITDVRLVGFVHSHPYCDLHEYGVFSGFLGDEGSALLTGCCYLIEPSGRSLYKITASDVVSSYCSGSSIQANMSRYKIYSFGWLTPYISKYHCGQ